MSKTIKLENRLIVPVFEFLQNAVLKGKATRGRTQFLKRLEEKSKEFNEALETIRKEHFLCDEDGELLVFEDDWKFKEGFNTQKLESAIDELNKEEFEISFFEHSTKYESLFKALDEYDVDLTGKEAFGYSELMDAYEENEEEK